MTRATQMSFEPRRAPLGRGAGLHNAHHRGASRGFTLIELLVVIAIIGVLSTVVLASLSSARKKGRDGRRISDIKQLQLALELYYDANNQYPTTLSALTTPGYIASIPTDPGSNLAYAYVALVGASADAAICSSFHLGAKLEQYNANPGSPFLDDFDGTPGGTYGTGQADGPLCSGSTWAGSADIAASSGDFDGSSDATTNVYDVRP